MAEMIVPNNARTRIVGNTLEARIDYIVAAHIHYILETCIHYILEAIAVNYAPAQFSI